MEQYISKSALAAEINKLTRKNELYLDDNVSDSVRFQKTGAYSVLNSLLHFLDTLEVKEVDLEKEIKNEVDKYWYDNGYGAIQWRGGTVTMEISDVKEIAKHFFELGLLKTQKEK